MTIVSAHQTFRDGANSGRFWSTMNWPFVFLQVVGGMNYGGVRCG